METETIDIEAYNYFLAKIFSNEFEFQVPPYQRPYSWSFEKAEALFNDLLYSLEYGKSVETMNPYFLGCIVLEKPKTSRQSKIIDGQQRLTTLTILLSALRTSIEDPEVKEEIQRFIYQKGSSIEGTADRYRLRLRERDNDFFKTYIQDASGLEKLGGLNPESLPDSQKLLRSNALGFLALLRGDSTFPDQIFSAEYRGLSEKEKIDLSKFIVQRSLMVVVSTPSLETAYRIFSILNDRGFNISLTDILKAEVIGKINNGGQESYTRKWENLEDKLGRDAFRNLFSHIRMVYRKAKLGRNVLAEFREYVINVTSNPEHFIDSVLCPYGESFYKILKPNNEANALPPEVKEMCKWLNKIENSDWIPPAIHYLHNRPSAQLIDFFKDLERLASGLMILRKNINMRISRYSEILNYIDRNLNLFDTTSPLQLKLQEQEEIWNILNGKIYLNKQIRQYVLLRLDSELSQGEASYYYDIISIEHVLPQKPKSDSSWIRLFSTQEREDWLHRIANLVLLSRSTNSSSSNYDFTDKKSNYFQSKTGTSPFALTSQVLREAEWNPALLEQRQQSLMATFETFWRLTPNPARSSQEGMQRSLF